MHGNNLLNLKYIQHLWKIWEISFIGGVCILSELAHWTLPHEIPTPSAVDLTKMLHRGCEDIKWSCLAS